LDQTVATVGDGPLVRIVETYRAGAGLYELIHAVFPAAHGDSVKAKTTQAHALPTRISELTGVSERIFVQLQSLVRSRGRHGRVAEKAFGPGYEEGPNLLSEPMRGFQRWTGEIQFAPQQMRASDERE
jgi:hypothetical protein